MKKCLRREGWIVNPQLRPRAVGSPIKPPTLAQGRTVDVLMCTSISTIRQYNNYPADAWSWYGDTDKVMAGQITHYRISRNEKED